jgi:hypothetical protein
VVPVPILVPMGDGEESALLAVLELKSAVLIKESEWELPTLRSELPLKQSVVPPKESEPPALKSE